MRIGGRQYSLSHGPNTLTHYCLALVSKRCHARRNVEESKALQSFVIYIYSIYSQPITTRYMQIGTIEAKYKEKITHNPTPYN